MSPLEPQALNPQQASPPAGTSDDEIDLRQLLAALQRRWRLVAQVAGGTFVLSGIVTLLQKPVWEGEFQIVLAASGGGGLAQLAAANPMLANLAGIGGGGGKDSLETEVKILESPSVLKPVFDFVKTSKARSDQNVEGMRFSDWIKSVSIKLEKGTSVLNISYSDTDKDLVLPVIQRISSDYQDYSGRDRRRDIASAIDYLNGSIARLAPKAEASMQRAQAFALANGLGLQDGMPASAGEQGGASSSGGGSVDASRQVAQSRVLLLQQQLTQARDAGPTVLFQAPQLEANTDLYRQYQATEARLSEFRSRLRDNDELVRNLQRQRLSLIGTLNRQTIGLLEGELATAQATLQSSSRTKEVVLKHRELVRQALRDDRTLVELENQLQLAQLEQAKQNDPWELISTPTLLDRPVSPRKGRNLALGLLAGLVLGSGAALVVDRRSGLVFGADELRQLLPYPLLAQLNAAESGRWGSSLELLSQGPLAGAVQVALVPAGALPEAMTRLLQEQLQQQLQQHDPAAQVLLTPDLAVAARCSAQLLLLAPGAASRPELAQLQQNLQLQAKPVAGLLLVVDGP